MSDILAFGRKYSFIVKCNNTIFDIQDFEFKDNSDYCLNFMRVIDCLSSNCSFDYWIENDSMKWKSKYCFIEETQSWEEESEGSFRLDFPPCHFFNGFAKGFSAGSSVNTEEFLIHGYRIQVCAR